MYELTFLANPNIAQDELQDLLEQIKSTILRFHGTVKRDFVVKKINLAYPIKKLRQGYLCAIDFELESDRINEIKELIKNSRIVLRHLLITKRIPKAKPIKPKTLKPKTTAKKPKERVKAEELDKKIEEILEE